jgi:hypothetical protein
MTSILSAVVTFHTQERERERVQSDDVGMAEALHNFYFAHDVVQSRVGSCAAVSDVAVSLCLNPRRPCSCPVLTAITVPVGAAEQAKRTYPLFPKQRFSAYFYRVSRSVNRNESQWTIIRLSKEKKKKYQEEKGSISRVRAKEKEKTERERERERERDTVFPYEYFYTASPSRTIRFRASPSINIGLPSCCPG